MLDNIISLVKQQVSGAITNNAQIPEDKKTAVVETTTSTIISELKDHLTPDNLSSIVSLFGSGSGNTTPGNVMTNSIQNSVVSALSQKVGLSPTIANTIASTVVPAIMGLISKKDSDPNDSFNLKSLVESFAGSDKGGILGKIGGLFGK